MLTLKRKEGQCIIIEVPGGDVITIKVVEAMPYSTRIGIDASPIYTVIREELIMSLYEIIETTELSQQDAERYKEILNHYQYRTGCSNIDLKTHHKGILEYARKRPEVSLIAAAYVYLARNKETIVQR